MPCFQRDFHLQGTVHSTLHLRRLDVVYVLFVLSLLFMSPSQLVLVLQVVDDMSLFTPHEADVWPMSLPSLVFSLSFPEWRLSRYPSSSCTMFLIVSHHYMFFVYLYVLLHVHKVVYSQPLPIVHPSDVKTSFSRSRMQSWVERLWCCKFLTLTVSPSMI